MRRYEQLTASYEPEGAWFKKQPQSTALIDDQNTETADA
jgi:hypothetical protein